MKSDRKEKSKKFAHIIAGFVILIHALERYDSGHQTYMYFVLFGLLFLSIAIFHHALKSRFAWIDTVFFGIEAILSIVIAYEYFHVGKTGLTIAYVLAALFQLIAIFVFARRLSK